MAGRPPNFFFEGDGKTTNPVLADLKTILISTVDYFMVATPINSLERSLKRTHVHGSHLLFLQVELILPLVQTHPENVTCQSSLGE